MKIKKSTIVRTIFLVVAIVNRFLTTKGFGFNLFMNEELAGLLADAFLSIVGVVVFWYNNSFTQNAIAADNYLADLNGAEGEDEVIAEGSEEETEE